MNAETKFDPRQHRLCETRYFDDFHVGERFNLPSRTMTDGLFSAFQLASAEMKKTFAAMATEIEPVTPQALRARIERDLVQWGELIRAAGIQPE